MDLIESVGSLSETKSGFRARLIEANVRGSSAYYSAEVLEAGAHLFKKGTHMYINHQSLSEREDRPEGDVNQMIGVLASDAVMESDGLYADLNIFSDRKDWLKERADHIGLSIRASGTVEESDEGPVLKEFSSVKSVDVVTVAGAGGKFVSLAESAVVPKTAPAGANTESKEMTMDAEITKAFADIDVKFDALTETLTEALAKIVEAKVEPEAKDETATVVESAKVFEALLESDLTKAGRGRILAGEYADDAALAEAIKAETDELAEARKGAGQADEFDMQESGQGSKGHDYSKGFGG